MAAEHSPLDHVVQHPLVTRPADWGFLTPNKEITLLSDQIVMMIVAGVAEVISAFQIKTWGKFLLWVLLGLLYVVAGFVTFQNPLLAAVLLTLVLGASLVASGIMRIILAFSMKRETPWIWVALSGVITVLLGVLILARWPVSSLYILGLFLGIDLIMAGVGWIGLGFGLRRTR